MEVNWIKTLHQDLKKKKKKNVLKVSPQNLKAKCLNLTNVMKALKILGPTLY